MRLKDKIAVITGAGGGIGRATAERFAKEGARIVINDIVAARAQETVDIITRAGGQAVAAPGDVTVRADVQRIFATALDRFGTYDVLINNAGILRRAAITDLDEDDWERIFRVNVRSMFLCTQEAARYWLKEQRPGKIVNLGSVTSIRGNSGAAHYAATKGAIKQYTESCALELGPHGINVNAIGPGMVPTNIASGGGAFTPPDAARLAAMGKAVPIGRPGTVEDIAAGCLFLASDEASYITGHLLIMDGGRTIATSSTPR